MSDFFKKALGVFVEFDEQEAVKPARENVNKVPDKPAFVANPNIPQPVQQQPVFAGALAQQEIDKFTKHFSDLFDKSNFPGPDYYEFTKMMQMLEAPIPDENTRISAVFATLSIQGLTKEKIVESARQYCTILENDKAQFEKAAADKAANELDSRKSRIAELEKKIADNSQAIQKLTQEITAAQSDIGALKNEMIAQDSRISANKGGFQLAYQAMYNKISSDIQKINSILK